ncbi:SLAM family member 5-like [Hypanus sabinus]|uniref:SLAM family member 5-like n=1 Tax=Hypanus sabinus TaxID=79690 RepID=UPI0028C43281|nr:SLAM family member 5-like [Hypanus sabinus]
MGTSWNCAFVLAIFLARTGASPAIVNGTLGHSVSLLPSIPVRQDMDEVVWRRSSSSTKIARYLERSIKYFNTSYNNRITLHSGNFSLEIHDLRKEDADEYEVIVTAGDSGDERRERIQLKVYELVSGANITAENITAENITGSCNFTLTCAVTSGDPTSFTWWRNGEALVKDSTWHIWVLGNMLEVHHTAEVEDAVYICEARNPISNEAAEIKLRDICKLNTYADKSSNSNNIAVIAAIAVIAGTLIIVFVVAIKMKGSVRSIYFTHGRRTTEGSRPEDPSPCTIYSEVQAINRTATNRQPPEGNEMVHSQEEMMKIPPTVYDTVKTPRSPQITHHCEPGDNHPPRM